MQSAVQPGSVVQIGPTHDNTFGGCFLTVEEVKPWGVTGYVMVPHAGGPKLAYYRCKHEEYHPVGAANWLIGSEGADAE